LSSVLSTDKEEIASKIRFQTSEEWVTNATELTRLIEHVMGCIVEMNQKNREIITWTEFIHDAIDKMAESLPTFKTVTNSNNNNNNNSTKTKLKERGKAK
jgi:hypothetical protein